MKLTALLIAFVPVAAWSQIDVDRYAWQFPAPRQLTGAGPLIDLLRQEAQALLDAGPLAPARVYFADQTSENYSVYTEPGRTVTTLAYAYPWLTRSQQAATRAYVRLECSTPGRQPWAGTHLALNNGTQRERHPKDGVFNQLINTKRPIVHTVYGLWLYAWRSGDWGVVRDNWSSILSFYRGRVGEADLYGTMSAHIAMVRMARHMRDAAAESEARANLSAALTSGLDFARIERNCWDKNPSWTSPYPEFWDARRDGLVYRGFMFLNLSPEMGRFLNDHVRTATLDRHAQALALYPNWWVTLAPYWCRWTGDEGVGAPTELHGMIVPIARWVAGAPASQISKIALSPPLLTGDCYWIESLVTAIEAHGQPVWVDVRRPAPRPATDNPAR